MSLRGGNYCNLEGGKNSVPNGVGEVVPLVARVVASRVVVGQVADLIII